MRIAFVLDHFDDDLSGSENQIQRIVIGLAGRHSIHIVVLRESPWLESNARRIGCSYRVIAANSFRTMSGYIGLVRLVVHLRELAPDVVHTFFPASNIIGVIASRLSGVRRVFASRRDYGEWMSPRYLAASRIANRVATGVIANSERVKDLTVRVERLPESKVLVVRNGIDISRFAGDLTREEARIQIGLPLDAFVVGLVANFRPMKHQHTFVEAAARVLAKHPRALFVFVGENASPVDLKSEIRRSVVACGLEDKVLFKHASGNIEMFLAALDVGVNCSAGEGLSNAIMEYMAARVPCVVSDSGGNPDLISHEHTGLLFPLDDAEALARHVERLMERSKDARQYADNAYRLVASEMSNDAMLRKIEWAYSQWRAVG